MDKNNHEQLLQSKDVLLELIESTEWYAYQKQAMKDVVEYYCSYKNPMGAYFSLETWLYDEHQAKKPTEIKSAMIWGALWVVHKLGIIDWNTMREMYGEFMSKQMGVR